MLKWIKTFFHLMTSVATTRLERQSRAIRIFDLVSMVPHPRPKDVYMVYSFSDDEVYLIRWSDYIKTNKFNADPNDQVIYNYWQAQDNLYKISGRSITPYLVLLNASKQELHTLAFRLNHAFYANLPLMGLFIDQNDHHLMLIAYVNGTIEDGTSLVYDLDMAPSAGIIHNFQIAHTVRTRDIVNNYVVRPIEDDDLVKLVTIPWRKEVLNDIALKMLDAIRTSETKKDNFFIRSRGLTDVNVEPPTKQQKITVSEPVV